jgi:nitroreductase
VALAAVLHLRTRPAAPVVAASPIALDTARALFPGAAALGPVAPGRPVAVLDEAGAVLGSLLDTQAVAAANPGYGGPVPCVIGLSPAGLVIGVRLLPNAENPTFVDVVLEQGLLQRWNGLTAAQAAARSVDAVSGATMTSLAVGNSVQQTLAALAAQPAPAGTARRPWTPWLLWGVLAVAALSFLGASRLPGLRLALRLAAVVGLGVLTGTCLSLALGQSWLAQGVPWKRMPFLATVLAAAVLVPVLTGRSFYCAHLCPFGCAQDLAGMLWPWWRPRLPRWLAAGLHVLRGAGLIVLYVLLVAGVAVDLAAVEPFAAFQWRSAPWPALALAVGFLLVTLLLPRAWCQHLCPTGYVLECCRGLPSRADAAPGFFTFERGALVAAVAAALVLVPAVRRGDAATSSGASAGVSAAPAPPAVEAPDRRAVPDVLTVIHERRSVREYSGEPVLPAQLDTLVRAAMAGPSAGNAQPWAFVVVTEQKRLERLAAGLTYGKMLAHAGAALIVCGVRDKMLPGAAAPFWVQDCSAAAENVLLAAQGLGLGAVWVGVYPYPERMAAVRSACAIPATVEPLCVISIGRPAGIEQPKDKYSADNVHWETW